MNVLKNKNFILASMRAHHTLYVALVLVFLSCFVFSGAKVAAEDKPVIPLGCPGSTLTGPATSAQLQVCANIPAGCPGSTQTAATGSVVANTADCPYAAATSGKNPGGSEKNSTNTTQQAAPLDTDIEADCTDTSAKNCGITRYLIWLINLLAAVVGVTVVAVMIAGGIQYSTSAGDPQAAAAARKRISNALLALVSFGLMYGFLQWLVPGGVL